jgi:hypothetical protein
VHRWSNGLSAPTVDGVNAKLETTTRPPAVAAALRHAWPPALGAALAGLTAVGLSTAAELSMIVAAAALVYLGAAALGRRWTAWLVFPATVLAIGLAGPLGVEAWPVLLVAALAFLAFGAVRGRLRRDSAFTLQALGMLGFGVLAAAGLLVAPTLGAYLVAAGLIGHGVWDAVHYRRDAVVPRAYASFCGVLDVVLGIAVLVLA